MSSICSPAERHSWVLNQLFLTRMTKDSNPQEVCGAVRGTIQKSDATGSSSDACQIVMRQAGPQGTGTITSTPSNLPTATQDKSFIASTASSNPKSVLSNGAKGGIIAAVVLAVLISLALCMNMLARRKRKRSALVDEAVHNPVDAPAEDKSPDTKAQECTSPVILDGANRFEADGKPVLGTELPEFAEPMYAELAADQEIIELPAKTKYDTLPAYGSAGRGTQEHHEELVDHEEHVENREK
jgi:hypothetical protein